MNLFIYLFTALIGTAQAQSYDDAARAYRRNSDLTEIMAKVNERNIQLVQTMSFYESKLGGLNISYCSADSNSDQQGFSSSQQWCHQNQCLEVRSTKEIRFNAWQLHPLLLANTLYMAANSGADPAYDSERKKEIRFCIATSGTGLQCKLNSRWATCYGGGQQVTVEAPDRTPRERVAPQRRVAYVRPASREHLPRPQRPRPARRPIIPNAAPDNFLHP